MFFALFLAAFAAAGPTAVPIEGQPFEAKLVGIDADWQLAFSADGKEKKLPAADLVCWGRCAETTQGPIVVTADGGLLVADVYKADKESVTADSLLFGELKLPLTALAGIVFDPPAGRQDRDRLLTRVARADGNSDRIILHNGDEVAGLFEGIRRDDKTQLDAVTLATDVGPAVVETARIAALIFNPALKASAAGTGVRAWAGFSDGSRVLATRLVLGPSALAITAAGQTWKALPQDLVWLQPLGGRAAYLSHRAPVAYRHVPFLELAWPYEVDRNVTGGMLRCGGRLYPLGLGVHSAARLSYQLDKPYRRFQSELGIDDSTAGRGSVRARVYVDGQQRYASETIRGGDAPLPISVDLTGAKRLDLIVDFADRADELDHADWIIARLVE
jgi:hypothetical protein